MRERILVFSLVLGIMLLFCPAGRGARAPECIKDGVKYGVTRGSFRGKWWNYQERGMSYVEGECYEAGLADLEKAIELRTEVSRQGCDQRRARTYGMHFVDYFGHRERGIALYHLGRLDEAQEELEFSLECVESSKAQYYLDQMRKTKLELSGADLLAPGIELVFPSQETFLTNQLELELKGKAWDDFFVKEIWVNGEPLLVPLAEKNLEFKHLLKLSPGWNKIKVLARDLMSKESFKELKIFVDREGPDIAFDAIKKVSPGEIEVKGSIYDRSGITRLGFEGNPAYVKDGKFNIRLRLSAKDSFKFRGEDKVGNYTEGVVHLVSGPRGTRLENEIPRPVRYASLANDFEGYPMPFPQAGPLSLEMDGAVREYPQVARNELWWNLRETYEDYFDKDPPIIQLKNLVRDQTVYFKELYFEGNVSDRNPLKEVSINGRNILRAGERKNLFFNQIVELKPGRNRIVIRAVDNQGNKSEKRIRVMRVIPEVHQVGNRYVVSMLPFYLSGSALEISDVAYDNLVTAIVDQERFNFVDRSQVEAIVGELKLSAEDLVDPVSSLKVGKMTAAEGMIVGYLKESPGAIELYARLVDVESSEILLEKDAYDENKSLSSLQYLTRGLAMKLRNEFPLVEGKIVKREKNKLMVDVGKNFQIKPGMKMIFFIEEEIVNPDTGIKYGADTRQLGEGKVVEVYDRLSLVEIDRGKASGEMKPGELAITK